MLKKIISLLFAMILSMNCLGISTFAYDTTLNSAHGKVDVYRYQYISNCTSTLTISGNLATCKRSLTGYYGETESIEVTQTLQRKNIFGGWSYVDSWNNSIDYHKINVTNYSYGLDDGTYRLVSDFTVYTSDDYEETSKTSQEVTFAI